jgi:hypothetical protein
MRRTPDIEDQIKDLQNRLDLLKKRVEEQKKAGPITFTRVPLKASGRSVVDENGATVATCNHGDGIGTEVAIANARLFAEAQRMFSVLVELREEDSWDAGTVEDIVDRVNGNWSDRNQSDMGANGSK